MEKSDKATAGQSVSSEKRKKSQRRIREVSENVDCKSWYDQDLGHYEVVDALVGEIYFKRGKKGREVRGWGNWGESIQIDSLIQVMIDKYYNYNT